MLEELVRERRRVQIFGNIELFEALSGFGFRPFMTHNEDPLIVYGQARPDIVLIDTNSEGNKRTLEIAKSFCRLWLKNP